mmetsp:Transcript_40404/g.90676  ORF Transcript_40404/g.90676 Transcript_40404/m.90676 type:complete len:311 (+) Transcript_40404:29-961(+)
MGLKEDTPENLLCLVVRPFILRNAQVQVFTGQGPLPLSPPPVLRPCKSISARSVPCLWPALVSFLKKRIGGRGGEGVWRSIHFESLVGSFGAGGPGNDWRREPAEPPLVGAHIRQRREHLPACRLGARRLLFLSFLGVVLGVDVEAEGAAGGGPKGEAPTPQLQEVRLGDGEDGLGPCRATVPRVAAAEYLGAGGLVLVPQRLGLLQPHRREGHRRGPHLILGELFEFFFEGFGPPVESLAEVLGAERGRLHHQAQPERPREASRPRAYQVPELLFGAQFGEDALVGHLGDHVEAGLLPPPEQTRGFTIP